VTAAGELYALAERCEQAAGPYFALDHDIVAALDIEHQNRRALAANSGLEPNPYPLPAYTASLDAAMTLVPEGWHVGLLTECDEDDYPAACLTQNAEPCSDAVGKGVDMVLSLCAAALRARASQGDGK
jgi:hypothetical protein